MINRILLIFFISFILSGCAGVSSKGIFGTGVSVAFDPRTVGTQIDDSIMQKNLSTKVLLENKSYFLSVKSKVLDGRIFLTGKVEDPEEKLKLTKIAWLRTAFILNKNIKATNYQIDTYKSKIYIYGIALNSNEKNLVIDEAKQISDVKDIIASILLVEDLRIQKN